MTDQAQPTTTGQDQATPDPTLAAAPPAPVVQTPAPGPWAQDLATRFPDDATRGQVDQFLREKIQPYTTQLEQKAAAGTQAQEFLGAFQTNPLDAYVSVTTDMFGEEAGTAMLTYLQQQVDQQAAEPGVTQEQAVENVATDPRVAAALEFFENTQASQAYDTELARIKAAHPEVDEDSFHTFVAGAEGNFDMAYNLYSQFVTKFGVPQPAADPPPPPAPVLGSDTATAQASTTQVQPRAQTIAGAVDDMMNDFRAAKEAPPVGVA